MNRTLKTILHVKFNANFLPKTSTNSMYKTLKFLKLKDVYKHFIIDFIHLFTSLWEETEYFSICFFHLLLYHNHNTRGINFQFTTVFRYLMASFMNFLGPIM